MVSLATDSEVWVDNNLLRPLDRFFAIVAVVSCVRYWNVRAVGDLLLTPSGLFLNYGKPGEIALGCGVLSGFKPPFDFHEQDPNTKTFVRITDLGKILEIGRQISPITHASADDPPTLIIHGDADSLVPIQQAEVILDKLKSVGVETKLVVRKGGGHGWPNLLKDMSIIADWFDAHLKPPKDASSAPKP